MENTNRNLRTIKGIGEAKAGLLAKLGIDSVDALLRYYPRDYKDYTLITHIDKVMPETVVNIKGKLEGSVKTEPLYRQPISRSTFTVSDGSGTITIILYHKKQMPFYLKRNTEYIFSGKAEGSIFDLVMSSPTVIFGNEPKLQPVYPLKSGITSKQISKMVENAFDCGFNIDPIPESIRKEYGLCDLEFAIRNIHFPVSPAARDAARKRLAFEELFTLFTAFSMIKRREKTNSGITIQRDYSDEFFSTLPFQPTSAQVRVVKECISDIMSSVALNRLVQGDVGSGKTAVAAALCYTLVKNGYQAAIMAPTEILSRQHFDTFSSFFKGTGITCELFTGSLTAAQKQKSKVLLREGKIDVAIGTHALISEGVEFNNLGLVITDEQHRFGVAQRLKLAAKGSTPHRLVMSATPIPRTLALIIYGDLDVSIIDEYPKNRQTVESYCVTPDYRERIYNFLKKNMDSGRQCYIVCPLVEENDTDLISATEYFANICNKAFTDYKVGLLHGKMKPAEKEAIMNSFSKGEIQLLVCTTVVEVGIDVPNATVMVIENAERFGMSQLHQLRGRIGRGQHKSTCIFISPDANNRRLDIMCKTGDGFKIADEDLKMRGPGDFIGRRQHGLPEFKIADLNSDMALLRKASIAANKLIENDPYLEKENHSALRQQVEAITQNSEL